MGQNELGDDCDEHGEEHEADAHDPLVVLEALWCYIYLISHE